MSLSHVLDQRYRLGSPSFAPPIGEVFHAYDVRSFRSVTVWLIPFTRAKNAQRFVDEQTRLFERLGPQYTPAILGKGLDASQSHAFVVYEPILAPTIEEFVKKRSFISEDEVIVMLVRLLKLLTKLHEIREVHGSISTRNVLIYAGELKVIGYSLELVQRIDLTPIELRPFLAPEIIKGSKPTVASDLFAVGSIMRFMLDKVTGFSSIEFPDSTGGKTFSPILNPGESFSVWKSSNTNLMRLVSSVQRLTSVDPELRPSSAEEALHNLINA